jgi:predicted deacetylase
MAATVVVVVVHSGHIRDASSGAHRSIEKRPAKGAEMIVCLHAYAGIVEKRRGIA